MRWMDIAQASDLKLAASESELVYPGVLSTAWFSPFDEFNQNEQINRQQNKRSGVTGDKKE